MRSRIRLIAGALVLLISGAMVLVVACGGNGPTVAPSPSPSPTCGGSSNTTTVVIANNSVCPQNITVPLGSQVTFINQDSQEHDMYSDPHPEHTDCPELNQVGVLQPGQSRQSGNLVVARSCGFHDHHQFQVRALQGTITIR